MIERHVPYYKTGFIDEGVDNFANNSDEPEIITEFRESTFEEEEWDGQTC